MDHDNSYEVEKDNLEEQKIDKDKKSNSEDSEDNYMSLGMCLGVCLGMAVGQLFFNNVATGLSLGMCLGLAIGINIKKKK